MRADKFAPYGILDLTAQPWHSQEQEDILLLYNIATIVIFILTFLVLFGETAYETFVYIFIGE